MRSVSSAVFSAVRSFAVAAALALASAAALSPLPALAVDPAPAGAASAASAAVVKAVEAKYAKVEAIQADFVQVTKSEAFGEDRQAGSVVLKRPKKMFWDFQGEQKKQFVTDGKTLWVYSAADNQVIRYDDISGASSQADALLTSLDSIDELFVVEPQPDAAGHTLKLSPRQPGQVKGLVLELDKDYVLERVVMTDSFDNVTDLQFSKVQLGVSVPDSKFQFQVPAGAEVISASSP